MIPSTLTPFRNHFIAKRDAAFPGQPLVLVWAVLEGNVVLLRRKIARGVSEAPLIPLNCRTHVSAAAAAAAINSSKLAVRCQPASQPAAQARFALLSCWENLADST